MMSMTMFAAYDHTGVIEPQFFAFDTDFTRSELITSPSGDRGIWRAKGDLDQIVVGVSDDSVLIHFGTIVAFLDSSEVDMLAVYPPSSPEHDREALDGIAQLTAFDSSFMADMREYRKPVKSTRSGNMTPPQSHLCIALVTDLLNSSLYASTAIDSEVAA